jgi:hypothetical protein
MLGLIKFLNGQMDQFEDSNLIIFEFGKEIHHSSIETYHLNFSDPIAPLVQKSLCSNLLTINFEQRKQRHSDPISALCHL